MASYAEAMPSKVFEDAGIKAAAAQCEKLFATITAKFSDETNPLLSPFGLALLQQHLSPGATLSVLAILERRLEHIRRRRLSILIAGEMASGKTTLLNILMGGSYLPMSHGKTTSFVCEIHHSAEQIALIKHKDGLIDDVSIQLPSDSGDQIWVRLRDCIKTGLWAGNTVVRTQIYWPMCVVQQSEDSSQTHVKETYTNRHDDVQLITSVAEFQRKVGVQSDQVRGTKLQRRTSAKELSDRLGAYLNPAGTDENQEPRDEIASAEEAMGKDTEQSDRYNERHDTMSVECSSDYEQVSVKRLIGVDEDDARRQSEASGSREGGDTVVRAGADLADTTKDDEECKDFKIVFMDCPGIEDKDVEDSFGPTLDNVARCQAFMFVIDTCKDHGVHEKQLQLLMSDVKAILENTDMNLNPDSSLFIANKGDLVPVDDRQPLIGTIMQRLQAKWPLIDKGHFTAMQASKILLDMSRGDNRNRDRFYNLTRAFIRQALRLTLEEHCMWLLNLLEVAYAIVHTDKHWPGMKATRQKLNVSLRERKVTVIALQEMVSRKDDVQQRQKYCKQTNQLVCTNSQAINDITWTVEEVNELLPDTLISGPWEDVSSELSKAICGKISEIIFATPAEGERVKKNYTMDMADCYRNEISKLEKLENALQGLFMGTDGEAGLANGLVTYLFPVAVSATVRMAPVMFPFIFLLAPLAPVPLVIASIVEDIREFYVDDNHRMSMRADKLKFVKNWSDVFIRKLVSMSNPNTAKFDNPLFRYLFDDSHKARFGVRLKAVLGAVNMLMSGPEATHGDGAALKGCVEDSLRVYAGRIMRHNVQEHDITWIYYRPGMRVKIGSGGEASVYEAEVKVNGAVRLAAVKEYTTDSVHPDGSLSLSIDVYRDCFMLRQLSRTRSRHIVQYIGSNYYQKEDCYYLRLFLERCLGDLKIIIRSTNPTADNYKIKEFLHYAHETAMGLKFLHDNNIVHRDIKPSNYLLQGVDGQGRTLVKITDFGSSKPLNTVVTQARNRGTPVYWSPEVAASRAGSRSVPFVSAVLRAAGRDGAARVYHTMESDVYSLGLVFWELWFRTEVYNMYDTGEGEIPKQLPPFPDMNALLKLCLSRAPTRRAKIGSLVTSIESAMQKYRVSY